MPVCEVDTQTGNVLRTLRVQPAQADNHYMPRMAASFADEKFRLVVFTSEHAHHSPGNPARRAVFPDVQSGQVLKDVAFALPNHGNESYLVGDVLDDATAAPTALRRGVRVDKP